MSVLIDNIGELFTASDAGILRDVAVVAEGDRIAYIGPASSAPAADQRIDAQGMAVLPGFVDSHSHIVFAADRAEEFAARMAGQSYTGGGIRTTVASTQEANDEQLRSTARRIVREMGRQGTTTVEIKSGYGLTIVDETRQLAIASEFTDETTYLGAHTIPADTDADEYVQLVCSDMLAAAAPHAKWVDVFCERVAFDADQSRAVLKAGMAAGLLPRVHANQLGHGPGVQLAVELGAASADHCTYLSDADIDALANSDTVATLLPGVEFSTRSPYPDARALIDAGVSIALASDCNPGSCYTSSLPFCIAVAVRDMGMTPEEAVIAATAGGARALRRTDIGSIEVGKRADLTVLSAPSHIHLAYRPGTPQISTVISGGAIIHEEN